MSTDMLSKLTAFYHEREAIRIKKETGEPRPWTKDPILRDYRFCNMHREDDRVTRWISENWRTPYDGHRNMVTAMILARLFNQPSTLAAIGFPENFLGRDIINMVQDMRRSGARVFNGAYIVSTNGISMDKVEYVVGVASYAQLHRGFVTNTDSLAQAANKLMSIRGLGGFLAGQVIADLKFTQLLSYAPDWWSWCASGPGSRRGLNRMFGRNLGAPWKPAEFQQKINWLQEMLVDKEIIVSAQDCQNMLCEFDKYERTRLGVGVPKQRYTPAAGT